MVEPVSPVFMLSVLYYVVLLVFTLVYFFIFLAIFLLTVLFDRRRAALHAASRFWALTIFRMNPMWKLRIEGLENMEKGRSCVVVVNHRSMLDIPLMYVLPLNFRWVSKKEVYRWPVFGLVLWMHGDITIERGAAKSVRKMMEDGAAWLGRGVSVMVFPEGTRSGNGDMGRFREGAFSLARHAGVGVLPCVSEGTGSVMDGWKVRMPHEFVVRVLEPVDAGVVASSDPKALAAGMQALMGGELDRLKKEIEDTVP